MTVGANDHPFKIFNLTPHAVGEDVNKFFVYLETRALPDPKIGSDELGCLLVGNFKFNDWCENAYSNLSLENKFFKDLLSKDRIVQVNKVGATEGCCDGLNLPPEKNFYENLSDEIDGHIVSSETFNKLSPKDNSRFTTPSKISVKDTPLWWKSETHIIDCNTVETVSFLKNYLKYSSIIRIYDPYIDPCGHDYDGLKRFFPNIGNKDRPNSLVDIEINRESGAKLPDHNGKIKKLQMSDDERTDMIDRFKNFFAKDSHITHKKSGVKNIRKVTVRFWKKVHKRYILSNYGGFMPDHGLQDRRRKKGVNTENPEDEFYESNSFPRLSPSKVDEVKVEFSKNGPTELIDEHIVYKSPLL